MKNKLSNFLVEQILLEDTNIKKQVVVYSGRFQPFHKGHFHTYTQLVKKFGKDNVYVGTSNKTDNNKSPFSFKEKKQIMTSMFPIPKNKIIQLKNPYQPVEILKNFDEKTTAFIPVVGEKDGNRLGGKYYTKYDGNPTQGHGEKGYVYVSPAQKNAISGTEVRNGLGNGTDDEKKDFFSKKAYPKFNQKIFDLITKKLNESFVISKEVIEEWLLKEATIGGTGQADDGPTAWFPNFAVFNKISVGRAKQIGYDVIDMIMTKDVEDYYEHPTYPDGPANAVSYYPAGVIGKMTPNNQVDIYSSEAYSMWYKHVTRKASLAGYEVIQTQLQRDAEKKIKKMSGEMALADKELEDEFNRLMNEEIKLPVEVGDTLLMGKWKNKKVVVKTIGTDEHGMPTINGKKVVTFRYGKKGPNIFDNIVELEGNLIEEATHKLKISIPKNIVKLQKMFKKSGFKLYVVGGAVRDAILGKTPHDFDLATDAKPDEVLKIAKDNKLHTAEVGKQFGVVLIDGDEIATFRKDIGKGRRPDSVDYTDIAGDVKRRDLTINALFYDLDRKEIVDLVGGIADIKKKRIKTVGKAEDRFDEDELRKLRAFRFHARVGGKWDKDTETALKNNVSLKGVSGERIHDEFLKSVESAKSVKTYLDTIEKFGYLKLILPNLKITKPYVEEKDYKVLLAYLLQKNTNIAGKLNKMKYSSEDAVDIDFLIKLIDLKPIDVRTQKIKQEKQVHLTDAQIKKFGKLVGKDFSKFLNHKNTIKGQDIPKGLKGKENSIWMDNEEKKLFLKEEIQRLDELAWQESAFKMIRNRLVPITNKTMSGIFGNITINTLHVTDFDNIQTLKKLEGSKKALSTFTKAAKGSNLVSGRGIQTGGGIMVALSGKLLMRTNGDMMSKPDKQGRRWLYDDYLGLKGHTHLKPLRKLNLDFEKKYSDDTVLTNKAKAEFISKYIEEAQKLLIKHKKTILNYAFNFKEKDYGEYWDEILINNIKINKMLIFHDEDELVNMFFWSDEQLEERSAVIDKLYKQFPNVSVTDSRDYFIKFIKKNGGSIYENINEGVKPISNFKSLFSKLPSDLQKRIFALKHIGQSPEWHPEGNVLKHTIMVVNRAMKSGEHIDYALAAIFHDIGKDETAGVHKKTGKVTHYGHEKVSNLLVKKYANVIKKLGGNLDVVEYIVANHMRVKNYGEMRAAKQKKFSSDKHFSKVNKFASKFDKGGLGEAMATKGSQIHKFITGKNLTYKGKKYPEIEFEVLGTDNGNKLVQLKILAPKKLFGNEMNVPFRTIKRGPFLKTETGGMFEANFRPDIAKKTKIWYKLDNKEILKISNNIIDLVQTAYKTTKDGSFVNSKSDINKSQFWNAIDIDNTEDADAVIFGRKTKFGIKIQGIGHDGEQKSKAEVLKRNAKILNINGYWVEASDAMEHIFYKMGVPYISSEKVAQSIFPNTDLKMTGKKGQYTRKLGNGKEITETIFGKPKTSVKEDKIPGGLADGKTLADIANHHKIEVVDLMPEYRLGIKTEMEHTSDKSIAEEIARDHLFEDPKYYTKLEKMENGTDSIEELYSDIDKMLDSIDEGLFKSDNSMKPHDKLIAGAVIEYMKSKFGFNSKITVRKKTNNSLLGDVVLNDNSLNKNKFTLHYNPNQSLAMQIQSLIHELTHVVQISKKHLKPSDDYKSILWKGKDVLKVSEYKNTMKNISEYMKLPWEAEAYSNMKKYYKPFLKSKFWQDLKGKDETLDYMINNIGENLITEGGAYGHMHHPFDTEINLTFGQLKDIVNKSLDGNLEFTREKTDGQALAISWKNGKLIAARNKGHLKNKGENALDIKGIASKFQGRGGLTDAYNFAMRDLSKAISALSKKQRDKIFDNGGSFMNIEVIWPNSVNVIPYGQPLLVFHGTMQFDVDGNAIGENTTHGRVLAGMVKQVEQNVQDGYTIQGPPVIKLPKNQTLSKLKPKYLSKISKIQKEFGLKDTAGVAEYHQAWWENWITKNSPTKLDNTAQKGLVKRWAFYDKSFRLDKKNITAEKTLEWAKKHEKDDHRKISKDNMMKFEDIFLGVGADVLEFTTSVLTVNPDKALRAMKDELKKTIKDVRKQGDLKSINKLKLELRRLNAIGGANKLVPSEGIVFVYNGHTMKLSGTFASLNQILGIFFEK